MVDFSIFNLDFIAIFSPLFTEVIFKKRKSRF